MFVPTEQILNKYADLLINYALGGGIGIKKNEVVWIRLPEIAKPLYAPLRNAVLRAGGHPIFSFTAQDVAAAEFYELASPEQLAFFPELYMKGLIDQVDHMVAIEAPVDKYELKGVDSAKIVKKQESSQPFMEWRIQKELEGKFTWTIALFGTEALAADAEMSLEEYWEQIIRACYLEDVDPKMAWKKLSSEIDLIKQKLTNLEIQKVHIRAENIDLEIGIGNDRQWLGGGGRNIPSFEIFTSPDWRQTNGSISFDQPLFYGGNKIEGISLKFKNGRVVESSATKGQELLQAMIGTKNANKLGEFSLTDARHSQITKFMGTTLYDENMGGEQGNMHLALGMSYVDTYKGNPTDLTDELCLELGFNNSAVHQDIITTVKKEVIATIKDGTQVCIYKNGEFQI